MKGEELIELLMEIAEESEEIVQSYHWGGNPEKHRQARNQAKSKVMAELTRLHTACAEMREFIANVHQRPRTNGDLWKAYANWEKRAKELLGKYPEGEA